jgi:ribonuclease BN (tRNA processing enzyme)
MNLDISALDVILLTHSHIDHTADVPGFLKAGAMTQTQPIEFTIVGPVVRDCTRARAASLTCALGREEPAPNENSFGATPENLLAQSAN